MSVDCIYCIYPPDSRDNVVDIKHKVILTHTLFEDTSSTMSAYFLFGYFIFFSIICRFETHTYASFLHYTKCIFKVLRSSGLMKEISTNSVILNINISGYVNNIIIEL